MSAYSQIIANTVAAAVTDSTALYKMNLDEADSNTTYIGKALPGSLDTESVWQIRRITTTGNDMVIEFAALGAFEEAWTNRAVLTYS